MISHGSASNNMVRQIGAAIGTATLISIMQNTIIKHEPARSLAIINRSVFISKMNTAFLSGVHATLLVAVGISAIGIIITIVLFKSSHQERVE